MLCSQICLMNSSALFNLHTPPSMRSILIQINNDVRAEAEISTEREKQEDPEIRQSCLTLLQSKEGLVRYYHLKRTKTP